MVGPIAKHVRFGPERKEPTRPSSISIDADMLSERMQAYFGDTRMQAQRLIAEARDIQQQFVNMDNVLRQPQLDEVRRRIEIIRDQLAKIKFDIGHSDKRFEDERRADPFVTAH